MGVSVQAAVGQGEAVVHVSGPLGPPEAKQLYEAVCDMLQGTAPSDLVIDLGELSRLETSGIATLSTCARMCRARDTRLQLSRLSSHHEQALLMMVAPTSTSPVTADSPGLLVGLGERAVTMLSDAASALVLLIEAGQSLGSVVLRRQRLPAGSLVEQSNRYGVDALPIVGLLSFLLGAILAFQAAHQLRQFGANVYAVDLVAISMVREFSPMVTGIILAGRSGAAIAAELGSMTVQQELDALRTMGIDPLRYLVVPRLLALLITQPALTLLANVIGVTGGLLIAVSALDISVPVFVQRSIEVVGIGDLGHGLFKSLVFAVIVGGTGAYAGLNTGQAATSVGRAATRAVVAGIFLIILADSAFAMITTWTE